MVNKPKNRHISELQAFLTVLFTSSLLISNVITSKQIQFPFNITMTGAIFIFPVTYILSDLFSEVYGYRWSRITCYLAFAMNVLMVAVFSLAIYSPSPDYWTQQEAFKTVLGNTPRNLLASLAAFVIGDFINDRVFRKMKAKYTNSHKRFGARAILSSFAGELADSLVFLPIAFLGKMPLKSLIVMTVTQVFIKTGYEIVVLPLTSFVVKRVSLKENGN